MSKVKEVNVENVENVVAKKSIKETDGARKYKGKVEVDTRPKIDVVISSEFPEVIHDTFYKKDKVQSFEKLDNACFTRFLAEDVVRKGLRKKFPEDCKSFIFSGFDGDIIEYIRVNNNLEKRIDVFIAAGVDKPTNNIPSYMKQAGPRAPKNDTWAT